MPPSAAPSIVLLVENDESAFDATARALRGAGLQVLHATNVIDALDILQSTRPVDALLAAVRLPGQPSGFTLARMGRRKRPRLPVLYLSGSEDVPPGEAARALGPILPGKPKPEALAREIQAALDPRAAEAPPRRQGAR